MTDSLDCRSLAALYDRGLLVPFIGSGMSDPVCTRWEPFIKGLEQQAGFEQEPNINLSVIERGLFAIQRLRLNGADVARAVRASVYTDNDDLDSTHSPALASFFWPLVCTTNYDDVYLRAKLKIRTTPPRVIGRSEADCHYLLQHLSFPVDEVLWALQGFLEPEHKVVREAFTRAGFDGRRLEEELVVGHAEYRQIAHRTPHFRRCFAELFRSKSLFFLGSGLGESYFRALFDEIIELFGPPIGPHFAIVQEGQVVPRLMREQYHIECYTYPRGQHSDVSRMLNGFMRFLKSQRARSSRWGFHLNSLSIRDTHRAQPHFEIARATLPSESDLPDNEAVAISCGRAYKDKSKNPLPPPGAPMLSDRALLGAGGPTLRRYAWINDYTVKWGGFERSYGIVARELSDDTLSSRDARSPEAIRTGFRAFLEVVEATGIKVAHVQLLSAGKQRVFHPWVSLVQMARAYGQWCQERTPDEHFERMRVIVYVVDPSVIALIDGGYVNLAEQLENTPLRIRVEVIDTQGKSETHYKIVDPDGNLNDCIAELPKEDRIPKLSAYPVPTHRFQALGLNEIGNMKVREFGLVSGSTFIVDYRSRTP
ncbi:SIR2 family protein [Noviherbaspirillum sp. 1P10PC]|uniref:SIR2 family NAD-dependent protein deacylase n=1 Tax=Noviherbaspirillum sp. 1P10PC TaxID=3132292 RepID=UPI0039A31BE2